MTLQFSNDDVTMVFSHLPGKFFAYSNILIDMACEWTQKFVKCKVNILGGIVFGDKVF